MSDTASAGAPALPQFGAALHRPQASEEFQLLRAWLRVAAIAFFCIAGTAMIVAL